LKNTYSKRPVKTTSTTATTEAGAPCKGDCDAGVVEYKDYKWDFSFKYPEDFIVTVVNNEVVKGQKDLRITNKPGALFLPGGGPAEPAVGEFLDGIQFYIRRLSADEVRYEADGSNRFSLTTNPLVTEIMNPCDGAGCANRKFYIQAGDNVYFMEVRSSSSYQSLSKDIEAIVSSIKE
jgi:hypothetical protein